MMLTLYGIPNCDSVKKTKNWLNEQHVDFVFHDVKKAGVTPELINSWLEHASWETLVNRKGTTWRNLSEAEKSAVIDNASALNCMINWPSVIKRPVLVYQSATKTQLVVGFLPDRFHSMISV